MRTVPRPAKEKPTPKDTTAHLGFEAKLWLSADTASRARAFLPARGKLQVMTERQANLRKNTDAAEPSGANRVERDSLLKAARRAHAGACGKQTAAGSPKGERGGANQFGAPLGVNLFD